MNIDPKKYGLNTRTVLIENEQKEIIIVINRKSRIIMKDGRKILEKARKIQPVSYTHLTLPTKRIV